MKPSSPEPLSSKPPPPLPLPLSAKAFRRAGRRRAELAAHRRAGDVCLGALRALDFRVLGFYLPTFHKGFEGGLRWVLEFGSVAAVSAPERSLIKSSFETLTWGLVIRV